MQELPPASQGKTKTIPRLQLAVPARLAPPLRLQHIIVPRVTILILDANLAPPPANGAPGDRLCRLCLETALLTDDRVFFQGQKEVLAFYKSTRHVRCHVSVLQWLPSVEHVAQAGVGVPGPCGRHPGTSRAPGEGDCGRLHHQRRGCAKHQE